MLSYISNYCVQLCICGKKGCKICKLFGWKLHAPETDDDALGDAVCSFVSLPIPDPTDADHSIMHTLSVMNWVLKIKRSTYLPWSRKMTQNWQEINKLIKKFKVGNFSKGIRQDQPSAVSIVQWPELYIRCMKLEVILVFFKRSMQKSFSDTSKRISTSAEQRF